MLLPNEPPLDQEFNEINPETELPYGINLGDVHKSRYNNNNENIQEGGAKDTFDEDISKRIINYKSSINEKEDIELEAMLNIKYRHTLDNKLLKDRNQKFYNQIIKLYKPPVELDYDSLVKIKSNDSKINYFTYNLLELQELFKKNSTQAIKIFL